MKNNGSPWWGLLCGAIYTRTHVFSSVTGALSVTPPYISGGIIRCRVLFPCPFFSVCLSVSVCFCLFLCALSALASPPQLEADSVSETVELAHT